jgi:hypothetical protein
VVAAVREEPLALGAYLALDDVTLLAAFRAWERDADSTLADLTQRLAARRLPKTLPLAAEGKASGAWQRAYERACEVAARRGFAPELWVWLDVPSECAYEEPASAAAEALWVNLRHRPTERLAKTSFVLGELCNKRMERPRLIFPAEIRADVLSALEGVIS